MLRGTVCVSLALKDPFLGLLARKLSSLGIFAKCIHQVVP